MATRSLRSLKVDENAENRGKKNAPMVRKGRKVFAEIKNIADERQTKHPIKKDVPKIEPKKDLKIKKNSCEYFNLSDYVSDIFAHLKTIEGNTVAENHLEGKELTNEMRMALVDWIVDVHSDYKLLQETLNLCIHILDIYLEKTELVNKYIVQLYALASLLIASKYQEIQCLEVADLVDICDGRYSKNEILNAESEMLKLIDYNLGYPMLIDFIRRYSTLSQATPIEHSFAKYFSELTLLDNRFCHVKPSLVAAACSFLAFCVSRDEINENFWPRVLIEETTYDYSHFSHLVPKLAHLVVNLSDSKYTSLKRKYAKTKMYCVSIMPAVQPKTGIINKLL